MHARRQFFDFHYVTQSPITKTALDFFVCLYYIEGQAKEAIVQDSGKLHQTYYDREKEVVVCGSPQSGAKYGDHLQFISDHQTQRTRALCMVKNVLECLPMQKKQTKTKLLSLNTFQFINTHKD